MTAEAILALLRGRATELRQRAKDKVSTIRPVGEEKETADERKTRISAQADWEAAQLLSGLVEEIECGQGLQAEDLAYEEQGDILHHAKRTH